MDTEADIGINVLIPSAAFASSRRRGTQNIFSHLPQGRQEKQLPFCPAFFCHSKNKTHQREISDEFYGDNNEAFPKRII